MCCYASISKEEEFVPMCGHRVHAACMKRWIEHQPCQQKTCPTCRTVLHELEVFAVHPRYAAEAHARRCLESVNVSGNVCWPIWTVQTLSDMIDAVQRVVADPTFQTYRGTFVIFTRSVSFYVPFELDSPYNEMLLLLEHMNRFRNIHASMLANVDRMEAMTRAQYSRCLRETRRTCVRMMKLSRAANGDRT